MFVTPNLCNDGHDATCKGPNTEGGSAGGLVGADLWLKHWMPMILASPAYKEGELLVVLTLGQPVSRHCGVRSDQSQLFGNMQLPDRAEHKQFRL